jgi:hypothetical protein
MPAVSKAQQRMGMVHAVKKGDMPAPSARSCSGSSINEKG